MRKLSGYQVRHPEMVGWELIKLFNLIRLLKDNSVNGSSDVMVATVAVTA